MRVAVLLVVVGLVGAGIATACGGRDACQPGQADARNRDLDGGLYVAFTNSAETLPGTSPTVWVLRGDACRPICREVLGNIEPTHIMCSTDLVTNRQRGNGTVTVISWGDNPDDIHITCTWDCQ